jgi:diaminopimelate epimerase
MDLQFTKGNGTGNDFVIIENFDDSIELTEEQVQTLCNRNFGVGADGVILVVRTESSEVASLRQDEPGCEWFMDYRNSDGSKAEMCGNGIRLFARYLTEKGLASIPQGGTLPIATRDGIKDITEAATGFAVDLGLFRVEDNQLAVSADGLDVARPALEVNVGNPHAVMALSSLEELKSLKLGEKPVEDQPRPEGLNYEFVVPAEPLIDSGVGRIEMRVFERGVGETKSCGTGVAAAALAVRHWSGLSQDHWQVRVPGGVLGVRVFQSEFELSSLSTSWPCSVSNHFAKESDPRCFCTTRNASPPAFNFENACIRSSCRDCFPIRIGGLDQIWSIESPAISSRVVHSMFSRLRSVMFSCSNWLALELMSTDLIRSLGFISAK